MEISLKHGKVHLSFDEGRLAYTVGNKFSVIEPEDAPFLSFFVSKVLHLKEIQIWQNGYAYDHFSYSASDEEAASLDVFVEAVTSWGASHGYGKLYDFKSDARDSRVLKRAIERGTAAQAGVDSNAFADVDKKRVIHKELIDFQYAADREAVGNSTIYQLNDFSIVFSFKHAALFAPVKLSYAGSSYHTETVTKEVSPATPIQVTKKRHGLAGAVIGTLIAPGVGTVAGALIGSTKGQDVVTGGQAAVTETKQRQVEDRMPLELTLLQLATGKTISLALRVYHSQYVALAKFKFFEMPEAPGGTAASLNDLVNNSRSLDDLPPLDDEPVLQHYPDAGLNPKPAPQPVISDDVVTQLERLKKLLDDGILTQSEFDEQKSKILSGN